MIQNVSEPAIFDVIYIAVLWVKKQISNQKVLISCVCLLTVINKRLLPWKNDYLRIICFLGGGGNDMNVTVMIIFIR